MQKNRIRTIFLIVLALSLVVLPVSAEMATASGSSGVSRGDYNTLAIYEAKETYKKSEGTQYVTPWVGIIPGSNSGCSGSRYLAYRYRLIAPDGTNYDQVVFKNSFDAGSGLYLSANDFFFTDNKAVKWLRVSNLIKDAETNGFAWKGTWTMEYYFGDYDCKKYEYTAYRPTSKLTFTLVDDSAAATATATQRPQTATPTSRVPDMTTTTSSVTTGSFSGDWTTNFGTMFLVDDGNEVTGTYEYKGVSTVSGTRSGSALKGTWSEKDRSGEFEFVLSADGNSFSGRWKYSSSSSWDGTWTGTKTTAPATRTVTPAPTQPARTSVPATTVQQAVTRGIIAKDTCSGTSGMTAYTDDRVMEKGSEVKIPIMVCNARDLANMDLSISYDRSVLKFISAEKGGLNANSLFESNEAVPGTIKISFASSSGNSGSGSVAFLTFTVIGERGTATPLKITVNTASSSTGTTIPVTVTPGTFTVGTPDGVTFDGGQVTARDALAALQMSVGKIPVDMKYDITGDGSVNSSDARAILKIAVGRT